MKTPEQQRERYRINAARYRERHREELREYQKERRKNRTPEQKKIEAARLSMRRKADRLTWSPERKKAVSDYNRKYAKYSMTPGQLERYRMVREQHRAEWLKNDPDYRRHRQARDALLRARQKLENPNEYFAKRRQYQREYVRKHREKVRADAARRNLKAKMQLINAALEGNTTVLEILQERARCRKERQVAYNVEYYQQHKGRVRELQRRRRTAKKALK